MLTQTATLSAAIQTGMRSGWPGRRLMVEASA